MLISCSQIQANAASAVKSWKCINENSGWFRNIRNATIAEFSSTVICHVWRARTLPVFCHHVFRAIEIPAHRWPGFPGDSAGGMAIRKREIPVPPPRRRGFPLPIGSMLLLYMVTFTIFYHQYTPNVSIYNIYHTWILWVIARGF